MPPPLTAYAARAVFLALAERLEAQAHGEAVPQEEEPAVVGIELAVLEEISCATIAL